MIAVRSLSKFYGKKSVVDDVTVTIQPGKITSFIGPNGAGKSTLLSMVSRLLDADTGEVLIDNADVRKMKSNDFAKRISILKQSNYMNVRLTIRELVSFGRFP
jgi:iron complex transport system ATP-binding protein